MPTFSVLIVNFNSTEPLEQALQSLEQQSFDDFDVFVVDNNSSDSNRFKKLAGQKYQLDIHFFEVEANLGFAGGINFLASKAEGDWITALNPDAVADKDWLSAAAKTLSQTTQADMLASVQIDGTDRTLLDGAGDRYAFCGLAWRAGHGRNVDGFAFPVEVFSPCGAAAFYRRDRFLALGGYKERFFCYLEDIDLGFRFRLTGGKCVLVRDALVYHIGGVSSGGKRSAFAIRQGMANLINVFVRCMPTLIAIPASPLFVMSMILLLLKHTVRGDGFPAGKGLWEGVLALPVSFTERRQIQANVTSGVFGALTYSPFKVFFRS